MEPKPGQAPSVPVLVIDTAFDRIQAGVVLVDPGGATVVEAMRREDGRGRSEEIVDLAMAALGDAGLDAADLGRIAVSVGPGSFTGLRVGIACARALALAARVPAAGIPTLDAFAEVGRRGASGRPVLAVVDARHGAAFAAPDGEAPGHFEAAVLAGRIRPETRIVGFGADKVAADIRAAGGPDCEVLTLEAPDIAVLAALGARASLEDAPPRPLYLKPAAALPARRLLARVP